jgi:hypothetical protein
MPTHWNGTPRTWTAGESLRTYQLDTEIRDRLRSLRYLNEYAVKLDGVSDQALKSGEREILNYDTSQWNVGAMWVSGSKVTIPVTGVYSVFSKVAFAANTTGSRRIGLRLQEADEFWCSTVDSVETVGKQTILSFVREFELTADVTVEFTAWQDTGVELRTTSTLAGVRLLGVTA